MFSPDLPLWLAFLLSGGAMAVMVAGRYLLASGLFAWMTRRVRPGLYTGRQKQIREEIGWSLISAVIYGAPAGLIIWGWRHHDWTLIYADVTQYPIWYAPLSVLIYLFLHDTWFYWTHRAMHHPRLFRIAHAVHHKSKPPTAWTAMSFHPIEAVLGALFVPVIVFLIPIHIGGLGIFLAVATIMGVTNHMGWEIFPRWIVHSPLGYGLITASHHERHHEEYRCNFGLYFRFWDHLCKTDRGLSARLASAPATVQRRLP